MHETLYRGTKTFSRRHFLLGGLALDASAYALSVGGQLLSQQTWTDSPLGRIFVNPGADGDAGIGVGVFAMGPSAQKLDQALAGGKQRALDLLHQIRPSTKGVLAVEDSISWGSSPFSLGAFSHYPAGGVTAYGRAVAAPEGALLFAGEHNELRSPGVEAALVSGRRTAEQALAMLRGEAAA